MNSKRIFQILLKITALVLFTSNQTECSVLVPSVPPVSSCQQFQQMVLQIKALRTANWMGYFTDSRPSAKKASGEKWYYDVNLKFAINNYEFSATGFDDIGRFAIKNGKIKGCKVEFLKVYATHAVMYQGSVIGTQMIGHWWLKSAPGVKGRWAMWPVSITKRNPNISV